MIEFLESKGQKISILANHFKVNVENVDECFPYCSIFISYEDGRPVDGKDFVYDREKSLFTVGFLPRSNLEFIIVLDDVTSNRNNGNASLDDFRFDPQWMIRRLRRSYQSKTFRVEISFAARVLI